MKKIYRIAALLLAQLVLTLVVFPTQVFAVPDPVDEHIPPEERPFRIEPEGDVTVYNVVFHWQKGELYEAFAAAEGEGIGQAQWPGELAREYYTFMGWYDNLEGTGEAYTPYTPIYQDTILYAYWKYSGPGGPWPRPQPDGIKGITENEYFAVGTEIEFTASGHNMHLEEPKDLRFRWVPVSWRAEGLGEGAFAENAPFTATVGADTAGNYTLLVTYREEVFDRLIWQETGQVREVEELPFSVGFENAVTNQPPATTTSPPSIAASSEDNTQLPASAIEMEVPDDNPPSEDAPSGFPLALVLIAVAVLAAGAVTLGIVSRKRRASIPPNSSEKSRGEEEQ